MIIIPIIPVIPIIRIFTYRRRLTRLAPQIRGNWNTGFLDYILP